MVVTGCSEALGSSRLKAVGNETPAHWLRGHTPVETHNSCCSVEAQSFNQTKPESNTLKVVVDKSATNFRTQSSIEQPLTDRTVISSSSMLPRKDNSNLKQTKDSFLDSLFGSDSKRQKDDDGVT